MSKLANPRGKGKSKFELIWVQRIHALKKIFNLAMAIRSRTTMPGVMTLCFWSTLMPARSRGLSPELSDGGRPGRM